MRKLIIILSLIFFCQVSFGQNKAEQTFKKVLEDGYSTAPDFVVLTIKNSNTGEIKELITDVTSLFEACRMEQQIQDYDKIFEYLLKNSKSRIFEFRTNEALERLFFYKYKLKSANKIEKLINKEKIIDSLPKITKQRELISEKFYEYSDKREEILDEIKDSIQNVRVLTNEEKKILSDLKDQYYDYHYNEYAKISDQGKTIMKLWNTKIKQYSEEYKKYTDELVRLEKKFFRNHCAKYGINFCHILFKYGVIFNSNCLNGRLEFNQVID